MPLFYFDCFDGGEFHPDAFGIELKDVEEAADHGACLVVTLMGEAPPSVGARSVSVAVRSAEGGAVYTAQCGFSGFKHAPRPKDPSS